MSKRVKQYLMLFAALGVVAIALGGGSGTFASFNAEVANNDNVFATGTLFLHDTANGGQTCSSESAQSNANLHDGNSANLGDNCDVLFDLSGANAVGGSAHTYYYNLTLKNAGSLSASAIKFYANSACNPKSVGITDGSVLTGTGGTPSSAISVQNLTYGIPDGATVDIGTNTGLTTSGATSPGAGTLNLTTSINASASDVITFYPAFVSGSSNLCSALKFAVWDMGATTNATSPAGGTCVYSLDSGSTSDCSFDSGTELSNLPTATSDANATLKGESLSSGSAVNLLIGIDKPELGNSYQSQKATVSLAWHIDQ